MEKPQEKVEQSSCMVGRLVKIDVKAMEKCGQQIKTFLDQAKSDEQNVGIFLHHNLHSQVVCSLLVGCKVNQSVEQVCSDYLCTASEA